MNRSVLDNIESIAAAGKAVMVGDLSTIEAIVKDAIENEEDRLLLLDERSGRSCQGVVLETRVGRVHGASRDICR